MCRPTSQQASSAPLVALLLSVRVEESLPLTHLGGQVDGKDVRRSGARHGRERGRSPAERRVLQLAVLVRADRDAAAFLVYVRGLAATSIASAPVSVSILHSGTSSLDRTGKNSVEHPARGADCAARRAKASS